MEKLIKIAHLRKNTNDFDNKIVSVGGWIKTIRDSKNFAFMEISDGSSFGTMQVVLDREDFKNYDEAVKYTIGSAVIVMGNVIITPQNKQPFEIKATDILLEGASDADFPLQKKRHGVEFLRTIAHLRPRTNLFMAAFRVRSIAAFAIHSFFNERGFVYVHTPIITASDCEGAGEMFKVTTLDEPPKSKDGKMDYSDDFFGKAANLTVSGQLNVETHCLAFGDVYTFGPTFRAENSNTPRHAAEFWMIEPEIAFADIYDDMDLAEDMMKYIINYVLENAPDEMG